MFFCDLRGSTSKKLNKVVYSVYSSIQSPHRRSCKGYGEALGNKVGGGISLSPLVVVLEDTKSQVLQIAAGPYHTLVPGPNLGLKSEVKGDFMMRKVGS